MSDHARHHRRRSTQVPISATQHIHNRLPRLFSGHSPAARRYEDDSAPEEEEEPLSSDEDEECLQRHSTGSSFLASAARTYSRAMYAHTTSQIASPDTGTLPGYNRTMHAFTLNQLNHMDNTGSQDPESLRKQQYMKTYQGPNSTHKAHIAAASPLALKPPPSQKGSQNATHSLAALSQMSLDEEPCGPSNTPEPAGGALAPAPTSIPSVSSDELLSQGRELEAKFNGLMAGVGVGVGSVVSGLKSEARDFAAVGLV